MIEINSRLNFSDVLTGIASVLVLKDKSCIKYSENGMAYVFGQMMPSLLKEAENEGLDLKFRIKPHYLHHDSLFVNQEIAKAMQRGIFSIDSPGGDALRILIEKEEAESILRGLPGRTIMYDHFADEFIKHSEKYVSSGN